MEILKTVFGFITRHPVENLRFDGNIKIRFFISSRDIL